MQNGMEHAIFALLCYLVQQQTGMSPSVKVVHDDGSFVWTLPAIGLVKLTPSDDFDVLSPDSALPPIASIADVTRNGDRLAISLAIKGETDWLYAPVYARIDGDKLVEWTTEPPPCFIAPPKGTTDEQ